MGDQTAGQAAGRVGVIVVGAGSGQRLGGVEKAFLPLGGRPLLAYSVEVFEHLDEVDEICLVLPVSGVARGQTLVAESGWRKVSAVVAGGAERQESVGNGLAALTDCAWVLVHDAARPLVTADVARSALRAARLHGAAVAATPVRDTLKRVQTVESGTLVVETVDRGALWAAQTPQAFRAELLRRAYSLAGAGSQYTDDAALVQAAGYQVAIAPGDPRNVKVTLPEDVALVEALVRYREAGS